MREAARLAGISPSRWAQLESGQRQTSIGYAPETAPAGTLARMAHVTGVTPAQLRDLGREDAAEVLARIETEAAEREERDTADAERAIGALDDLSPRQRAALVPLVADALRDIRGTELTPCKPLADTSRLPCDEFTHFPAERDGNETSAHSGGCDSCGSRVPAAGSHPRHRRIPART